MAKAAQNPVANRISVPFQNNFNFGIGPADVTQWVLNVPPVIPVCGRLGKILHWGRLPLNCQLSAYYNMRTPTDGPD